MYCGQNHNFIPNNFMKLWGGGPKIMGSRSIYRPVSKDCLVSKEQGSYSYDSTRKHPKGVPIAVCQVRFLLGIRIFENLI